MDKTRKWMTEYTVYEMNEQKIYLDRYTFFKLYIISKI
jgi:hypothetical protein